MAKRNRRKKSKLSCGQLIVGGFVLLVILAAIGQTSRDGKSTAIPKPSNTVIPRTTHTPESPDVQPVDSQTEQVTLSPTITDTPIKTLTPTPEFLTYYVNSTGLVNVRECGNTSCQVVTTVNRGAELQVIDNTGQYWYEIMLPDGKTGFISASLVSKSPLPAQAVQPAVQPTQPPAPIQATAIPQPVVKPTQPPPSTPVPVQPTQPPQSQWNCSGDIYNCGDFASCAEMRSYFNACPGDPSNLDGNNDGRACESRCG